LGFTSGPKVAHFERVEWLTLDQFSAMAALRSGEVDRWESPLPDLAKALTGDRDITVVPPVCDGHWHPAVQPPASTLQ
jgi:peptide/nickel transport system substrate-binding protein